MATSGFFFHYIIKTFVALNKCFIIVFYPYNWVYILKQILKTVFV